MEKMINNSFSNNDLKNTSDLLEKKRKRLERNRESARECRKRKKEKKNLLRQQLAHLEADNLQLRLKLQVGHETASHEDKSAYITAKLDAMIKDGASEIEIQKSIAELQERYSDYGRDRRSAIDFHVTQLRRCLQPTQTTRAILWLMRLAAQFHDPETGEIQTNVCDANNELYNLWLSLLKEVKPSASQKKLMVSYTTPSVTGTDPFQDINTVTKNCSGMLDRLVDIIGDKNNSLDNEMSNIQTILSARQIAKFILWIDQNPACMQMLEALWPHITYSNSLAPTRNNSIENLSTLADNDEYTEDDEVISSEPEDF